MPLYRSTNILFFVQILNYSAPLISIPIILKYSDVHIYNDYATLIAYSQWAVILLDFGFSIFGVTEIAKRADKNILKNIISTSLILKIMFSPIYIILTFVFIYVKGMDLTSGILILIYITTTSLLPIYVFHGRQEYFKLFMSILSGKGIFILILLTVELSTLNQYLIVLCLGSCISLIHSMILLKIHNYFSVYNLRWKIFWNSVPFSFAKICTATVVQGALISASFVVSDGEFAILAIADQLYRLAISVTMPVSQSFLPVMTRGFPLSKYILINAAITIILCAVIYIVIANIDVLLKLLGNAEIVNELSVNTYVFYMYGILAVLNYISRSMGYPLTSNIGKMHDTRRSSYIGCLTFCSTITVSSFLGYLNLSIILSVFIISECLVIMLRFISTIKVVRRF